MAVSAVYSRPDPPARPLNLGDEGYLRMGEVLRFRRNQFRRAGVTLSPDPVHPDDCRVVEGRDIFQFRFGGREQWASYREIVDSFTVQRQSGATTKITPFLEDDVFAPVKLVLRDTPCPIRAVLSYEPVYPARGKLAVLQEGQSVWMAYASLAVLNSTLGQAIYRKLLWERTGQGESGSGLSIEVLRAMPLAHRDRIATFLRPVVRLTAEVDALYEAERELAADLHEEISGRREWLLTEVCHLLGLAEEEARELVESVADIQCEDSSAPTAQLSLFHPVDEIPRPPSISLLSAEQRQRLNRLERYAAQGPLSTIQEAELDRLLEWKLHEDALPSLPARTITRAAPIEAGPAIDRP